jgi:hypothetical protein
VLVALFDRCEQLGPDLRHRLGHPRGRRLALQLGEVRFTQECPDLVHLFEQRILLW